MDILAHPNPALKQPATEVDPAKDRTLLRLVKEMSDAMYDAPGVGLAATQVGVQKRLIIFDLDDGLVALCNPAIVERSDATEVDDEGCLSLGVVRVPVERATEVVIEGKDVAGEGVKYELDGMAARVVQHELDHLDGVLILDRTDPASRKEALAKLRPRLLLAPR